MSLTTIVLALGVLAVVASWIVAFRLIANDKFSGTVADETAQGGRRDDVLVGATL
jgi:hypothetical protein